MDYRAMGIVGDAGFEELVSHFSSLGFTAVLMDPDFVAGPDHLISAAMHAERAFLQGTARSKTFETEAIIYAAWDRQIGRANDRMRPKDGSGRFALLLSGEGDPQLESIGMSRDDSILAVDDAKKERLGLNDPFLSAEDQALENVASVDLLKARSPLIYAFIC